MKGDKRKPSSLRLFSVAILLALLSLLAAVYGWPMWIWVAGIPAALVMFLWGAIRNHGEHTGR